MDSTLRHVLKLSQNAQEPSKGEDEELMLGSKKIFALQEFFSVKDQQDAQKALLSDERLLERLQTNFSALFFEERENQQKIQAEEEKLKLKIQAEEEKLKLKNQFEEEKI